MTVNGVTTNLQSGSSVNINLGANGATVTGGSASGSSGSAAGSSGSAAGSNGATIIINNAGASSPSTETPSNIANLVAQYGNPSAPYTGPTGPTATTVTGTEGSVTISTATTSYPSLPLPTGPSTTPNGGNPSINTILTNQARAPNGPYTPLSSYELNVNQLFNNQTALSNTVANLLDIIRQGTANRDQAQKDVTTFSKNLNDSVAQQQQNAINVNSKQGNIASIQSAIEGANKKLTDLNGNLASVNNQINNVKNQGLNLTQQLSNVLGQQNGLNQQIDNQQKTINTISQQLSNTNSVCSAANAAINSLNANISALQKAFEGINPQLATIDDNIQNYKDQIEVLLKRIRELTDLVSGAQQARSALIAQKNTIPQQITDLQNKIDAQKNQCNAAQTSVSPADLTNAQNTLANLKDQLATSVANANNINGTINGLKNQAAELVNQANGISAEVAATQGNLNTLKNQLPVEQNALNQLYNIGNNLLNTVKNNNASLNAANQRYATENNNLGLANLQLQNTRINLQEIQNKINQILQENTAGLPFPSASNASGLLSALNDTNTIDSIGNYLLRAYGSSLNYSTVLNAANSNVKNLYLFGNNLYSLTSSACGGSVLTPVQTSGSGSLGQTTITGTANGAALTTVTGTATGALLAGVGTISQVLGGNQFVVDTSVGPQTISLGSCGVALANVPNYSYQKGNVVVWKGHRQNANSWNANQVTCLR